MDSLLIKDLQAIFCDTVPLMKGGEGVCEKVYKKAYVGSNIDICLMFSTAYAAARCKTQDLLNPLPHSISCRKMLNNLWIIKEIRSEKS